MAMTRSGGHNVKARKNRLWRKAPRGDVGAHGRTRKLHLETLEDRKLLATGPQLIGLNTSSINPDAGPLEIDGQDNLLDVAPDGLTFRFDANQEIDPTTLMEGIKIWRSNFDG